MFRHTHESVAFPDNQKNDTPRLFESALPIKNISKRIKTRAKMRGNISCTILYCCYEPCVNYRCFYFLPSFAFAATKATTFEVSGWIPYWREATGTVDTLSHLQDFNALMPFGYIVQDDGSLNDAFGLNATLPISFPALLITIAKAEKVKIVPTMMWSNGQAIDTILSNAKTRQALETTSLRSRRPKGSTA